MNTQTLPAVFAEALAGLEFARQVNELEASHPNLFVTPPKHRDTCPECGSDNAHRMHVTMTERCVSDWHEGRGN